jgi:hypothetical protein
MEPPWPHLREGCIRSNLLTVQKSHWANEDYRGKHHLLDWDDSSSEKGCRLRFAAPGSRVGWRLQFDGRNVKVECHYRHSGADRDFAGGGGDGCREGSRGFHVVAVAVAVYRAAIFSVLLVRYYELIFGVFAEDR